MCHEYLEETYEADVSESLRDILYYKQTTDKKGRNIRDKTSGLPPILYANRYLVKDDTIHSWIRRKGVDTADYWLCYEKYCIVKLDLIVDSIYISENCASIQTKVDTFYIQPSAYTRWGEPMLWINDSASDEDSDGELE